MTCTCASIPLFHSVPTQGHKSIATNSQHCSLHIRPLIAKGDEHKIDDHLRLSWGGLLEMRKIVYPTHLGHRAQVIWFEKSQNVHLHFKWQRSQSKAGKHHRLCEKDAHMEAVDYRSVLLVLNPTLSNALFVANETKSLWSNLKLILYKTGFIFSSRLCCNDQSYFEQ